MADPTTAKIASLDQARAALSTSTLADTRPGGGSLNRMASAALSALRAPLPYLFGSAASESTSTGSSIPLSSDLNTAYERLISTYETRLAETQAREASFARVATAAVSLLRARDAEDVTLDRVWIPKGDLDTFNSCMDGMYASAGSSGPWLETEIPVRQPASMPVSKIMTQFHQYSNRPISAPVALVPFQRAFPLEVLELIVDAATPKSQAAFSMASLACLQHFGPRILARVDIHGRYYGDGPQRLANLFSRPQFKLPSRISPSMSLCHIKHLVLDASVLETWFSDSVMKRLRSREMRSGFRLESLTVRIDFENVGDHPDEDEEGSTFDCDECGGTVPMDEYKERNYSGCHNAEPYRRQQVRCWRPNAQLLSLFAARKLIILDEDRENQRYCGASYLTTLEAARTIAAWPRLAQIDLHNVHIYCLPEGHEDGEEDDELEEIPDRTPFFLSPEVIGTTGQPGRHRWSIRWFAHTLGLGLGLAKPFSYQYKSIPDELAHRDGTLTSARVKKASLLVNDKKEYKQVYAEIKVLDPAQRGPLNVFVRGTRRTTEAA